MEASGSSEPAVLDGAAESPAAEAATIALKNAETRKTAAEAEKAELDAQKAMQDQAFPAPASARPEGKLDFVGEVGLVADLLAHALVGEEAEALAKEGIGDHLCDDHRVLLVADRALAAGDWPYRTIVDAFGAFKTVMENAASAIDEVRDTRSGAPPRAEGQAEAILSPQLAAARAASGAVSSLGGGLADLVGWLRADYSIVAHDVTIGETPLMAALAGRLRSAGKNADVDGFTLLGSSSLLATYKDLVERRHVLKAAAVRLQAEVVDPAARRRDARLAMVKELSAGYAKSFEAKPPTETKLRDALELLIAKEAEALAADSEVGRAVAAATAASDVVSGFDGFVANILASRSTGDGYPPLLAAALHERLHDGDSPYTHVLYVNLESTGGEMLTKRWLWTDPKLRFIGGTQLSYLLYSIGAPGQLVAAGTAPLLGTCEFSLKKGMLGAVKKLDLRPPPAQTR